MSLRLFPLLSVIAAWPAIAAPLAEGRNLLTVAGSPRSFLAHMATSGPRAKPLVIVLHGGGGSAAIVQGRLGFDALADRDRFVVVYPDSRLGMPDAPERNWNDGRDVPLIRGPAPETSDAAFLSAIIDAGIGSGQVDRRQVFIVGASNGGMMTLRLACDLGSRIAGIGVVMASFPEGQQRRCNGIKPLPAIFIRGDRDDTVPFDGGPVRSRPGIDRGRVEPMAATLAFFARLNGCAKPVSVALPDRVTEDNTTTTKTMWTDCRDAPMAYFRIAGGGHTWPGVSAPDARLQRSGALSLDFDGATEIWSFLKSATGKARGQ